MRKRNQDTISGNATGIDPSKADVTVQLAGSILTANAVGWKQRSGAELRSQQYDDNAAGSGAPPTISAR